MKRNILWLCLCVLLSSCAAENHPPKEFDGVGPVTVRYQTEKHAYTGVLTSENGVYTWLLTEPETIAGVKLTGTDTTCALSVGDVTIPLDDRTAEHVWQIIQKEKEHP